MVANRWHGMHSWAVGGLGYLDQRLFSIKLQEPSFCGQLGSWAGMAMLWPYSFLTKVLVVLPNLCCFSMFMAFFHCLWLLWIAIWSFSGETEKIVPPNSLAPFSEAPANLKSSELRKAYRLAQAKIDGWSIASCKWFSSLTTVNFTFSAQKYGEQYICEISRNYFGLQSMNHM